MLTWLRRLRYALKLIDEVPDATFVRVDVLRPNDVIVVECEGSISQHMSVHVETYVQRAFPGVKVLVLSDGFKLKVVRGWRSQVEYARERLVPTGRPH